MLVKNEESKVKLFDISKFEFKSDKDVINETLKDISLLSINSYINHEQNSYSYVYKPDIYKPVLKNLIPIPPKSSWIFKDGSFRIVANSNIFRRKEYSKIELFTCLNKYINILRNKKIGVQLSGGLDSSLIIGILKHFEIDPILIGMNNSRYEFRTERIIQEIIKKKSSKAIVISDDNYMPFSNLLNVPIHSIPNPSAIFYNSENKMAELFSENNVDIVFNGMGLDTIFCLSPNMFEYQEQWLPFMFDNNWFHDYIYKPKNIYFTPAISSPILVNIIWNLRLNCSEDNTKKWARNYFSDFLPKELVKFSYKADHAGLLIDGIKHNFEIIEYLFNFVYEKTKLYPFSKKEFQNLFIDYHLNDDTTIKLILSRTSYAVWIYSLFNNKAQQPTGAWLNGG